jgi:UTP--glucose-1-phosphate uridylyltransferase
MPRPIRKAVFPVAGLGTRFLPATKAMPKEMLTVVDRPLIQYVVDEAREAGIEHFIFVTGRNKSVIEDHFDKQYELESTLRKRGKSLELDLLEQDLPGAGETSFTRQQEPLGLGHAIWCARHLVGEEPFAVLLPDMIMKASPGCLAQMVDVYNRRDGGNVIAVEETPWEQVHRYGVVGGADWQDNHFTVTQMVEKPKREHAPSNLIISGRYILQPEIFRELDRQETGAGGEIQITDAMKRMMWSQHFHGVKYDGVTYDCGDKVGFLAANIALALEREDIAPAFREVLGKVIPQHGGKLSWG